MNYTEVNYHRMDALKEFFNIGAGNAADTLSVMSGHRVMISVPEVHICKIPEISCYIGEMEREMIGICHNVYGGINGKILLLISRYSGEQLAKSLVHQYSMNESVTDIFENALKELSNIITGAYLNAFSSMVGSKIIHSVPSFAIDMTGALVDSTIAPFAERDDLIMILKTIMTGSAGIFEIYFLFFPRPDSLDKILKDVK